MKPTYVRNAVLAAAVSAGGIAVPLVRGQEAKPAMPGSAHVMVMPTAVQWADGPGSIPPGAQFAVIEGDPKNAALFTMRLKLPAAYRIPAHWHPADEHVTVISGTFHMGMGDKLDTTKGTALGVGSFAVMPTQTHHYAWTNEETVVQLHGMGPWGINYVNPTDDPRKK
jgi:mannose-6-phosphate isomerase-like protein (cupin superfamily)